VPKQDEKPVGLPVDMYERMAALAGKHQRTIRGEVRYALQLYLEHQERRNGQPAKEPSPA